MLTLIPACYGYSFPACLIHAVAFFQAVVHILYVYVDLCIFLRTHHRGFPHCIQCFALVFLTYGDADLVACRIFYFRCICALGPALEEVARSYRLAVCYLEYGYSICRSLLLLCRYGGHSASVSVIFQGIGIGLCLLLIHCINHQILASKLADICHYRCPGSKLKIRLNLIVFSDTVNSPTLKYILFPIDSHIRCAGCIRHRNSCYCVI